MYLCIRLVIFSIRSDDNRSYSKIQYMISNVGQGTLIKNGSVNLRIHRE